MLVVVVIIMANNMTEKRKAHLQKLLQTRHRDTQLIKQITTSVIGALFLFYWSRYPTSSNTEPH